jgi:hypothetical protein
MANYELHNFIVSGSTEGKIKIRDGHGNNRYVVDPMLSYFFYKNRDVIIKQDGADDIILDFRNNNIAIQAMNKLNIARLEMLNNNDNDTIGFVINGSDGLKYFINISGGTMTYKNI